MNGKLLGKCRQIEGGKDIGDDTIVGEVGVEPSIHWERSWVGVERRIFAGLETRIPGLTLQSSEHLIEPAHALRRSYSGA